MKGVDRFRAQVGGHIAESMGASNPGSAGGPLPSVAHGVPARYDGVTRPKDALTIPVAKLRPDPDQPRKDFDDDDLDMLARSLRDRGQLQPIRVRWEEGRGEWMIVSGERRWRAARIAGLETLLAVEVKGAPTDDDLLEDQLVENCVRSDLKPIEQAHAYKALMDRRGYSGRQLAEVLSISHTSVQRSLALLALPGAIQDRVASGDLAPSVAFEVSKLETPAVQAEVADRVVAEGMNRAEVVRAVREKAARKPSGSKGRGGKPRKVTEWTFRTTAGPKIIAEFKRGLDDDMIRAALVEALGQLDAERSEAAA